MNGDEISRLKDIINAIIKEQINYKMAFIDIKENLRNMLGKLK